MPNNAILSRMLDRLFASMVKGPCLNCRPHASRQRIDLASFSRMQDAPPEKALVDLLGDVRQTSIAANVPIPPDLKKKLGNIMPQAIEDATELLDATHVKANPAHEAWLNQRALLTKLRNLGDDARNYEQDTGVHALHVGYPLLSLPAPVGGSSGWGGFASGSNSNSGGGGGGGSRILAPIAFIPVSLIVRTGQKAGVDLACRGQGIDRVMPNAALLASLERQTGRPAIDAFTDEEGARPWEEIAELIKRVCVMLDIPIAPDPPVQAAGAGASSAAAPEPPRDPNAVVIGRLVDPQHLKLEPAPKSDEAGNKPRIYGSAVLGLFQMANQSLLRDTQSMIDDRSLIGPVVSFIESQVRLDAPPPTATSDGSPEIVKKQQRRFADERLIAQADPCQSRTVKMARQASGLVVHGPPGTGKSQTITNIIGDHLARGERVLFVCEKRTALDVVANRLDHLELGGLCALVHDPQRDQRDLYLSIRNQLDQLPETRTHPRAERSLEKVDEELQRLHGELTDAYGALMAAPDQHGHSFHELMGQWLSIEADPGLIDGKSLERTDLEQLESARGDMEVILRRGLAVRYPQNPWVGCVGGTLEQYLARPAPEMRRSLASCVEDARAADATRGDDIPPFNTRQSLAEQARFRQQLATKLRHVIDTIEPGLAKRLSSLSADNVKRQRQQLADIAPHLQILREGPLDAELTLVARESPPSSAMIAQQIAALNEYLAIAERWHAFIHVLVRAQARRALSQYGLPLNPQSAQRLRRFLLGLRARQMLNESYRQLNTEPQATTAVHDEELDRSLTQHAAVLDVLGEVAGSEELESRVRAALADFASAAALLNGLDQSAPRATALEQLETSLVNLKLFKSQWLEGASAQVRSGRKATDTLARFEEQFDTVEGVLRIQHDLDGLVATFRGSVEMLLKAGADFEAGWAAMLRGTLAGEIARRLSTDQALAKLDGERIAAAFDRYQALEIEKRAYVRDMILHRWRTRQKERLLVSTGTRLNGEGAKLRQRLFVRGSRAMRLRQVISIGSEPQGDGSQGDAGDPLFDLCPVWMASPETVAQIFPRRPLFDVAVFDEASQCKLEEALPVLTRAKRVVIAGDTKQLPPTRFFEAGVTESDLMSLETDQDLFETQQGEVEDLLAAALNLEIEESYLDVHYRSRNADLIEFSNQQFYGERLQAIPCHPANRTRFAPITLDRVDGVYDKRCNPTEAARVCEIVRDLLKRAEPPSIGIACFNLSQRDLIVESLDALALEDSAFAARLAEARDRRGEASFEGLFVKNLENVQGDERDHIIISTTYGPGPNGKFYRRFGPLGMPGGGRRLNVLVTRARHEVHLVTSIPREAYTNAPPIPAGQTPNGGWLLFAYLRYAEGLAEQYEESYRNLTASQAAPAGRVNVVAINPFSNFSLALARQLAAAKTFASDVHWGNEGFRIDLALHHPRRAEDMTIGVLCDFAQYPRAADPVEWDIFRTAVHESQGWQLQRIWSPQYFRDSAKVINTITREVNRFLTGDTEKSMQAES